MAAINFVRQEVEKADPLWSLADAVCDETNLETLLIMPTEGAAIHDKRRNEEYAARASWMGVASHTLAGLIGVAFEDEPQIDLDGVAEYLRTNCDGEGTDLKQQAHATLGQILRKGRAGLFVTYPQVSAEASLADQRAGSAVSTIHVINAERIVNWATESRGAKVMLSLVVFTDSIEFRDGYEVKYRKAFRELALEEGRFVDRTWIKGEDKQKDEWIIHSEVFPVDGRGMPWTEIPFTFVGAVDNRSTIDKGPLLSLCRLNRDLYRNSADNEESVWYAGQAQPFIKPDTNLNQQDIADAEASGFKLGARQVIIGEVGFAQSEPNTASRQAMIDKLEQMKALGARLIQPGTVAKTATEASGDRKVQHSILSLCVANIEDAYNRALVWVAAYMNGTENKITMSRDFMTGEVTAEILTAITGLYDRALLGSDEMLPILKRAKVIDTEKPIEDYREEVDQRGGGVNA